MVSNIDIALFHWINGKLHQPWLDSVMVYITELNNFYLILVAVVIGLLVFGRKQERVTVILLLVTVLLSDTAGSLIKLFFVQLRPEHVLENVRLLIPSSYSFAFPSNHAANTAAVATILIARYPKNRIVGIIAVVLALLISYSRIYVGVHYPSDVLGGFGIGIICALGTVLLLRNLDWKEGVTQQSIFRVDYVSLLILFSIILTILRLKYIHGNAINLSAEEAQYWTWSQHLDWSYYSKGPMIAYLIYLFTRLGGNTVFSVRLGAVLISFSLTFITYFFVKYLFSNRRIAFFSAIVMNLIPLFSVGTVIMTTDTPLLLFWVITIIFVYLAIKLDKPSYWYLAGISFGLGMLSKYTMVLLLPSLLIFLLLTKRERTWLLKKEPYIGLAIGLLLFSPVIYWNYVHSWISGRHVLGLSRVSEGIWFSLNSLLEFMGSQFGVITPWIFVGLVYAWWKTWSMVMGKEKDTPYFLPKLYLWCMSAPIFVMFLLKSIQGKVQANWAAPAYYTGLILTIVIFEQRYVAATSAKQKRRIAIYSWSSILLSGILVLFLHNSEYLVRLGIPMKAKYDLTNRLRGWKELGVQVSLVNKDMTLTNSQIPVFIFSDSYQIASELSFYVIGQPQTYCINLGRRMNQYDIWDGWDKLTGQNAIFVTDSQDELSNIITTAFSSCELAKQVPIYLYGEKIWVFNLYKCYNFRGLNTKPITNY